MGLKHLQNPILAGDASGVLEAVPKQQLDAQISGHSHTVPTSPHGEMSTTTGGSILILDAEFDTQFNVTVNHDITLNPPSNGTNGQKVLAFMLANAAQRSVDLHASVINVSGYSFPAIVPSGKRLVLGLARSVGTWYLLAARLQP